MPPRREFEGAKVGPVGRDSGDYPEAELTGKIIGCAIAVHRTLGPGFLEAMYEKALALELAKQALAFVQQHTVGVYYQGAEIGQHRIDLFVAGKVVVELKCVDAIDAKHVAQVISTLKAARVQVGLLINFNEARLIDGVRRVVLT